MTPTWEEANQQYLAWALARMCGVLQRHTARARGKPLPDITEGAAPNIGATPPALETLSAVFRLSPFERDLLLLCAGVELDSSIGALCAMAQVDDQRAYPTFSLALAALPGAHWSALTAQAPLRRWRLIEVASGMALTSSPLRIDERVLHYIAGASHMDERLAGLVIPVRGIDSLVPSHQMLAEQLTTVWARAREQGRLPVIQLCGDEQAGKRAIAAAACAAVGLQLMSIKGNWLPTSAADIETFARLWEREAVLSRSGLLIDYDDLDLVEHGPASQIARLMERINGALVLAVRERQRVPDRTVVSFDVVKPRADEQRAVWQESLGEAARSLNGHLDLLVSQFHLGAGAIRSASAEALSYRGMAGSADIGHAIWDACRIQSRARLDDLAQRIEPAATWDDLVLPEPQRQMLRDITTHVRRRAKVYDDWGFAARGVRGLGISALFAGASGTGKTTAAEVLVGDLRLDLYRIDLSAVVSKYIGETEKNLRRIFDAAEDGGAILLFDEADALFGKRTDVKDSHDRYANIEVSYLLQRMESYRGLAILTSNLKSVLDGAFLRRIRFVVQFPFPDAAQRAEIWWKVFPRATPTEGLDVEKLARLNITGGSIRNIALHAAFLAADQDVPVRMEHLLASARAEYAKLEKTLTEAETFGWC